MQAQEQICLGKYDSMDWNIRCKVEVPWVYWNLCKCWMWQLWSRLREASSISINFKSTCILCDVYSAHIFTIIYVVKGEFLETCVVTSFKIRNHYIVANMTVVVHSVKDCSVSSRKLWVKKLIDSLTSLLTFYKVWFIV